MKPNTFLRVQRRFGELFSLPAEQVRADTSPDSVSAWDSLQHLNLILVLEQEFRIQFTPDEIERLFSLENIARLVDFKISRGEVADGC